MGWFALALASGLAAIFGWVYPSIRSRLRAARGAERFRAAARALDLEPLPPGEDPLALGFVPTLHSVFGPYVEVHHLGLKGVGGESLYLFEVRFGRGGMPWSYRRRLPVVAFELRRTLPMFSLTRPRGRAATSRVTAFEARGQRLAVEAVGPGLELWSRLEDRERAKALVGEACLAALADDHGWDIRGVDRWLVLFNERPLDERAEDLVGYAERARALRALLGGRGAPRESR